MPPLTLLQANELDFPHPENSTQEGLLAVGGDLSSPRLLAAYSQGIFPWYEDGSPLLWWSPNPRLLLIPAQFKLSRSLRKALKRPWQFKIDTDFAAVMHACASSGGRANRTWITGEMQEAYYQLHQQGYAHSFEIWCEEQLIGGLYGISLGRAFFGESMFHNQPDASKVALFYLCQTLLTWQFDFIDCQMPTPHLLSMGAFILPRSDFLKRLSETLKHPTRRGSWSQADVLLP